MDFQTALIDLDSIETIEQNAFSIDPSEQSTAIEHLAHSIVKLGGIIRIPVVEQVKIDVYKLIAGHFDYYAYLKAREIEPELPDRLRVFIINPKKAITKEILTQLKAIERIQGATMSTTKPESNISDVDLKLSNLDSKLDQLLKAAQTKPEDSSKQDTKMLGLLAKISNQVESIDQRLPDLESDGFPSYELLKAMGLTHHQILKTQVTVLRNKGHKTPSLSIKVSALEEYLEKFKATKPVEQPEKPKEESSPQLSESQDLISSYEAFVEESMKILHKLNTDYQCDNLVPIYRLRRALGDRVDRTQFNEWILEMHARSVVELMGGNMPDLTPEIVEDSVVSRLGSAYYSVALD